MEFLLKFMSSTFLFCIQKFRLCMQRIHEGLPKNEIECSKYVIHPDKLESSESGIRTNIE